MNNKTCILIIEDDPSINENMTELLELENYCIYSANYAEEGLELAVKKKPNLIICDIRLSGSNLNGYDVFERLKKNSVTKSIPFAFVTAMTSKKDKLNMENLNIPYIFKPFNIKEFLNFIAALLNEK